MSKETLSPGPEEQDAGEKKKVRQPNRIEIARDYLKENYVFRINKHTQSIYVRKTGSSEDDFEECDNRKTNDLFIDMNVNGVRVSKDIINTLVYSSETPIYDPIYTYLNRLPPRTGDSAIRRLCQSVTLAKEKETIVDGISYRTAFNAIFRRWLIACVACGMGRGPNHICLVLVGAQRRYKTTWLNALCPDALPEYRYVGHIDPSTSQGETPNLLAEKWFVNIDDQLEVLFGRDFNAMKSVITLDKITNRKPYMPKAETRQRIGNFVASVNSVNFLTDTENRRYFTVEVEMCHPDRMPNMDDVWAEAYALYRAGEQHWCTQEEYLALEFMNRDYAEITTEQEWLELCFRPATEKDAHCVYMGGSEIQKRLIHISQDKTINHKRLGRALKRLGFERKSKSIPGRGKRWIYPVVELNYSEPRPVVTTGQVESWPF